MLKAKLRFYDRKETQVFFYTDEITVIWRKDDKGRMQWINIYFNPFRYIQNRLEVKKYLSIALFIAAWLLTIVGLAFGINYYIAIGFVICCIVGCIGLDYL